MPRRLLNPDGSLNIFRKDKRKFLLSDLYHFLLSLSWPRLVLILVCVFLILHFIFAFFYFLCGPESLLGLDHNQGLAFYQECFFFSVQTLATIGYGHVAPRGFGANLLVTFESFLGLFGMALMTGLLFARFSKPTSRVVFSKFALMTTYEKKPAFMFRIANERSNQIVEARVSMVLVKDEKDNEDKIFRRVYNLKIVRDYTPIFALSWTVIHPLDLESPLNHLDLEELRKSHAEIIVSVSGIDETFSQTIHSRYSYTAEEVVSNKHFKDVIFPSDLGIEVDLTNFHELE